jgi:DNA (cytosine-5)-methyltransferase 1
MLLSFFAGAGFLDLGFEISGYRLSFVNEIDTEFLRSYRYARSRMAAAGLLAFDDDEEKYYPGNICELLQGEGRDLIDQRMREAKRSPLVGFIGGPPCPDFSIGGKNRGGQGHHGVLTEKYVSLICQQQPDFFVLENVKGLVSTKKHREFLEERKKELRLARFWLTQRVVNALAYGVPQNRERVVLIGLKPTLVRSLGVLSEADLELMYPWQRVAQYNATRVKRLRWPGREPFEEGIERYASGYPGIIRELTVQYWFDKNDVTTHDNSVQWFAPRRGVARFESVCEGDDSRKSFKRLHRWRYSPAACYGNNEVHLHPFRARRLNLAEALAIQSLPREFALPLDVTLTKAFKMVGNGVPFLLALGIARSLLDFLQGSFEEDDMTKLDKLHGSDPSRQLGLAPKPEDRQ